MSFDGYKSVIEQGDTVILYLTINQIYCVKAEAKTLSKRGSEVDNVFQTPYGALKCAELIGKMYGTKITLSKGWGYILQPNPELWTITLPHRTQIIYTPDISMILLQLDLAPGSVVIESGTGSGSLSHALIRLIKPHGHLYTFDFHETRANIARDEFKSHGLVGYVTVKNRDVCTDGFGEDLVNKADAVFLDLPHPWQAIQHAKDVLKANICSRLCSFSPCIEQVQKTCEELTKHGFNELQTMEILQTPYTIQTRNLNVINLDFLKTEKDGSEIKNKERETMKIRTALPPASLPGHTGYMTFATLPPIWARNLHLNDDEDEEINDISKDFE